MDNPMMVALRGENRPNGQPLVQSMRPQLAGGMDALSGQFDAFRQARRDWRDARPERVEGMEGDAWRQMKMDWRAQRPTLLNFFNGGVQQVPTPVEAPIPAAPFANSFPGMVGSSLMVRGLNPAQSAFDLPTY